MKKSLTLSLLLAMSTFCLIEKTEANPACNRITCKHTNTLQVCMKAAGYGSYQDVVDGGDGHCATSVNELCETNECNLMDIGFDCSAAPSCQQ